MSNSVYPDALDSDLELQRVDDNITEIGGDVINSLRSAIFAIETAIGTSPQGNMSDLVSRINNVIDANGNIKASALSSAGLVSLPITNAQIGDNAGIEESKLNLEFSTSSLNSRVNLVNSDIDSVRTTLSTTSNQSTVHFAGLSFRHDGYAIDLQSPLRGAEDVESALRLVDSALEVHLNSTIDVHTASSIALNNEFRSISATNVQDAITSLDEISVASLAQNQDEIRETSITINDKGRQGKQGNLKETLFASTIFQTNGSTTTNILQVMRPNVTRVTSTIPNLRALNVSSAKNLRIEAGGIDRDALDINLSSVIGTQDIEDIVFVINTQCSAAHYPVSAYNTDGRLTIAHNIPGKEFTIQIKDDVSLSAHLVLGFADTIGTVFEWANNNYSASIEGSRILDMKSLIKIYYTHSGGSTISPGLGDLSLLGLAVGNEGRILCNITNHDSDSTFNGTYYITGFPTNATFQLADGDQDPISIPAGNFDLEVAADATNFSNSTNGQIFDIFAENAGDGYCEITKSLRVNYDAFTGVRIRTVNEDFSTDNIELKITDANEMQFLGDTTAGPSVSIPSGYIGQLKLFAADNVSIALMEIIGSPSSGNKTITVSEFAGNSSRLHLSSIHYSGSLSDIRTLRFVTDKRNFGGAPENFTNDVLVKDKLEEVTDELRSNGVVRGLDLISNTGDSLFIRGGRAYVDGRAVNVETQEITIQDFSPSSKLLLLDRNGAFVIKSEFDAGYSFTELIEGDSYGDNRGFATILEFEIDSGAIVDGYIVDRRLLISNIDKRVNDHVVDLYDRITQIQNVASGSFWGTTLAASSNDATIASLTISGDSNMDALDEEGFAGGNNLVTTRRFEFSTSAWKPFSLFAAVGLTHINIFLQFDFFDGASAPFGTSGKVEFYIGVSATIGIDEERTYEDYVLVKVIDNDSLAQEPVKERYVASIPLSRLISFNNGFFDLTVRVKITGSTYIDGGSGGGSDPRINFKNIRILPASYSIAGYILGEDGSSQSLATTVGDVL